MTQKVLTFFTLCNILTYGVHLRDWVTKNVEPFHDILIFETCLCLLATLGDLISTLAPSDHSDIHLHFILLFITFLSLYFCRSTAPLLLLQHYSSAQHPFENIFRSQTLQISSSKGVYSDILFWQSLEGRWKFKILPFMSLFMVHVT